MPGSDLVCRDGALAGCRGRGTSRGNGKQLTRVNQVPVPYPRVRRCKAVPCLPVPQLIPCQLPQGKCPKGLKPFPDGRQKMTVLRQVLVRVSVPSESSESLEFSERFSFHRNLLPDNGLYEGAGKTPRPRCHLGLPPPTVGDASARMSLWQKGVYYQTKPTSPLESIKIALPGQKNATISFLQPLEAPI